MRTGIVNLPLHSGAAPSWLFQRMRRLAREIMLVIREEFGAEEILTRLADPYWFQALGCVLGFDWHSSGVTTTACGALKEGIRGLEKELGVFIAGGKGKTSRKTPQQIEKFCEKISLDAQPLVYASRMSAKVDTAALQDGYQIYHHTFVFTSSGNWCVVQQGMNEEDKYARRYHWLKSNVENFVCEPHNAICCDKRSEVFNLVAEESREARKSVAELSGNEPEKLTKELKAAVYTLPRHHHVDVSDISSRYLHKIFLRTYERRPEDFEELLSMEGVGPKTVRALSLISELIYGTSVSMRDPVRFSFAHGGKDGHPYHVDRKNYDRSIDILHRCLVSARLGRSERLHALRRLRNFTGA